ncbi:XRE family transcriptional regulator [Pseudomonas fluorescens]|uniref:XRE family transcriptional regulator n=1 Tax=Pseudomonas fluorescens TaxID=294 RepID=A0A3S4QL64_PSEFL|nr:helix-turn-helix domain-containing protein [Pseudomonas fluorescens]VEF09695.1 XRE family transcriptional regulator [Pseudomonas fluorescens]
MLPMKRPRLSAVQALSDFRLALTFIDGQKLILDLDRDIHTYPGLHPLLDPQVFATVTLDDYGWTVEWLEPDIQIGADTLYMDALVQNAADENTRIFIAWRARTGLSLNQAAEALGVSTRSISRYSNGREPVPRSLALACLGWDSLQQNSTLAAEESGRYDIKRKT